MLVLNVSAPWAQEDSDAGGILGAARQRWRIVPSLSIGETFTDNLKLRPAEARQSDWVTVVRPSISAVASGGRLRLDATYAPEMIYRAKEGSSEVRHQLAAHGNAELVQRLLFLDASASIAQQNVSLLGPQTDSNVNNTGNRTAVSTYSVSPSLRHEFGANARGEARFTFSSVSTAAGGGALADSLSNRIDLLLGSGPAFRLLTWNMAYNRESIDYVGRPPTISERISAGARRLVTPSLGVLANVGYDNNNFSIGDSAQQGVSWSLGPEWTPTPRTRLAATVGRRVFGTTKSFDFSHRTRLTVWSAGYSEELTSTRAQALVPTSVATAGIMDSLFLARIPDPVVRQRAVQDFIAQNGLPPTMAVPLNFLTSQNFLVKRLHGSVGIHGVRNTVMANAFTQTREAETTTGQPATGDFALGGSSRQSGGSLVWSSRITAQTASSANAGYTLSELVGTNRQDSAKSLRLGLTHQFGPRLSGGLHFHRTLNSSSQPGASYSENAASALISVRF